MSGAVHAGCVARWSRAGWSGVLITGPSGAGKSDLALRLLERGWILVGDDRLHLWSSEARLYARAPSALNGLTEVRGVGVLARSSRPFSEVRLIVDGSEPERVPERARAMVAGVEIERVRLRLLDASAPAKVELAWRRALRSEVF